MIPHEPVSPTTPGSPSSTDLPRSPLWPSLGRTMRSLHPCAQRPHRNRLCDLPARHDRQTARCLGEACIVERWAELLGEFRENVCVGMSADRCVIVFVRHCVISVIRLPTARHSSLVFVVRSSWLAARNRPRIRLFPICTRGPARVRDRCTARAWPCDHERAWVLQGGFVWCQDRERFGRAQGESSGRSHLECDIDVLCDRRRRAVNLEEMSGLDSIGLRVCLSRRGW